MRQVADGVHLITAFPPYAINCYLIAHDGGDVLVDAMTRLDRRTILKAVEGRTLLAHVATHAHPDHVGGLGVLHEAFPAAPMYATPATTEEIRTDSKGFYELTRQLHGDDYRP